MKNRFIALIALASSLAALTARAQTTPPVLTVSIVDIGILDGSVGGVTVTDGGSGYAGNKPLVVFTGGGGTGAVATAVLDASGNTVASVTMVTHGTNYSSPPTVSFSGGGPATGTPVPTEATGVANPGFSTEFTIPNQNEASGPAGATIAMYALAVGTNPATGFSYTFTANGLPLGKTASSTPAGQLGGISWTPPQPGAYSLVASTTDGANNAVSQPVRYFATGTMIVSPEAGGGGSLLINAPGSLVSVGSTVIIQATSTPSDGFVSKIDFYTDWTGSTGTLIGTATKYPFSVPYQPGGAAGVTHLIKAIGYDNTGTVVPTTLDMDEILLTMIAANPNTPLPTDTIITPATNSLVEIPNYVADASAYIPVEVIASSSVNVTRVELYVNGVLYNTANSYPYNFKWTPQTTGNFVLSALAYDSSGNVVSSTAISTTSTTPVAGPTQVAIEAAPAIAITSPGNGATLNGGASSSVAAVAVDSNFDLLGAPIPIALVQFFQDGNFIGSAATPVSGDLYQISFKPVQNLQNGSVVPSIITAIATDADGFQGTSAGVSVNVTSGGSGANNVIIGTPPVVTLLTPTNQQNVIVNTPVTFSATGNAPNGNIASMVFLVDNAPVATLTKYPYATTFTFQNLGTYQVSAQVTDNLGDITTYPAPKTPPINIIVVPEPPPTVNVTTPTSGGTAITGTPVTVTAAATSPSGTVAQVELFENGISIGVATTPPYTESFTPLSAGVYTFTAIATDNSGETSTSSPVIIEAFPSTGGLGTSTYFGTYQGLAIGDGGEFAFVTPDGVSGTFISYSNAAKPTITYAQGISVSVAGAFKTSALNGIASPTGVSGTLTPGGEMFIGAATQSSGSSIAAGYYTGSVEGQVGSQITGILGNDGELMLYLGAASGPDAIYTSVDTAGNFSGTTANGNTISGKASSATGLMTATLTGSAGGTVYAGRVSGGTISDGVVGNISTRGQVGAGADVMIAGFYVSGTSPKELLVRAVGPTLSTFNLPGAIAGTQLQVFSGTNLVASNTGWSSSPGNTTAVSSADSQAGAFALPVGSGDSALVYTFAPGAYTAMVSGASGATGLGLVEIYDLDTYAPFTAKKLTNVSTRGNVGAGNNVLIGGFSFNGTAPKRLLIRGAGPGLTALNVAGALTAPRLQLYNGSQQLIRENYSWQVGNDPAMVTAAETATGAFAFANGSADAAILIVLPSGTYTAEVSGANGATGIALVEVYEVP